MIEKRKADAYNKQEGKACGNRRITRRPRFLTKGSPENMNQADAALIAALQENARTPIKALAKTVFLSPPAVSARIAKLEDQGIISGYHAAVDPLK